MYVKKLTEYRIHVGINQAYPMGYIIAAQKKLKRRSVPNAEINYQIRNHKNGWVFTRENVHPPLEVIEEAKKAVKALGLDFGAVDVGWNEREEKATVYEVNTACGMEGTTLDDYASYFSQCISEIESGSHT
jgi:D-alanine-D-alanine ligase-like ATP-grasp enzyme